MNTYQETIAERKSLVPSARHKKNGSKSRKCSLPSDNLTAAQKRKLNGPVVTYSINRPMPYDAFRKMPLDLQQSHIDYIQNRFGAGLSAIGREVFGIAESTLGLYCKRNGIKNAAGRGSHLSDEELQSLRDWVAGGAAPATPCEEATPDLEPVMEEPSQSSPEPGMESVLIVEGLSLNLVGTPVAVAKAIFESMADMKRVSVSITVKNL